MSGLDLTSREADWIAAVAQTEVPPSIARNHPDVYAAMVNGVVDTILNRVVSPRFPDTVEGVLSQPLQFTKITGPPSRNPYGSLQNTPAAPQSTRAAVQSHLDARAGGAPSSIGGNLHYANPHFSDQSNLTGWVNPMIEAGATPIGVGNAVHYHGTDPTGNFSPIEAQLSSVEGYTPAERVETAHASVPSPTARPSSAMGFSPTQGVPISERTIAGAMGGSYRPPEREIEGLQYSPAADPGIAPEPLARGTLDIAGTSSQRPQRYFDDLSPEMRQLTGDALAQLPQDLQDKLVITSTVRPGSANHFGEALDIRNRNLSPEEEALTVAAFAGAGAVGIGVYGPPGTGTNPRFEDGPHIHIDRTGRYGSVQSGPRQDNPALTAILEQHRSGEPISLQRAGLSSMPNPTPRPTTQDAIERFAGVTGRAFLTPDQRNAFSDMGSLRANQTQPVESRSLSDMSPANPNPVIPVTKRDLEPVGLGASSPNQLTSDQREAISSMAPFRVSPIASVSSSPLPNLSQPIDNSGRISQAFSDAGPRTDNPSQYFSSMAGSDYGSAKPAAPTYGVSTKDQISSRVDQAFSDVARTPQIAQPSIQQISQPQRVNNPSQYFSSMAGSDYRSAQPANMAEQYGMRALENFDPFTASSPVAESPTVPNPVASPVSLHPRVPSPQPRSRARSVPNPVASPNQVGSMSPFAKSIQSLFQGYQNDSLLGTGLGSLAGGVLGGPLGAAVGGFLGSQNSGISSPAMQTQGSGSKNGATGPAIRSTTGIDRVTKDNPTGSFWSAVFGGNPNSDGEGVGGYYSGGHDGGFTW